MRTLWFAMFVFLAALLPASIDVACAEGAADAAIPESARMAPAVLADLLKGEYSKLTILQVGSSVLYAEAHIPGSQYAGPAGKAEGLQNLEKHVADLPRDRPIVIYCGCCPWTRCPNIGAAYQRLRALGFTNVKALYLPNNFGDDWVNKGYPTAHGT